MKDKRIEEILKELGKMEASPEKRQELKKVLEEILKLKPEVILDKDFEESLKKKIEREIAEMKSKSQIKNPFIKKSFEFNFSKFFSYSLVGVAVILLVTLPNLLNKEGTQKTQKEFSTVDLDEREIEKNSKDSRKPYEVPSYAMPERSIDSESDTQNKNLNLRMDGLDAGSNLEDVPKIKSSKEIETEEKLNLDKTLNASKGYGNLGDFDDVQENDSLVIYSKILHYFGFESVDIKELKSSSLEEVEFSQEVEDGYSLKINFENNEIEIRKKESYIKNLESSCVDEKCLKNIEKNKIVSNEEIFQVANEFLRNLEIDMENYKSPEIKEKSEKNISVIYESLYQDKKIQINISLINFEVLFADIEI